MDLVDVDDVFATGDLHGNVPNLQAILTRADLARNPRRHLVLQEVVHGPHRYPNGGDRSHQVLDLVAALKAQFPDRVHFLPGNHEFGQMTGRAIQKGNDDLNELFRRGVGLAYGARADDVYTGYLGLIAVCPVLIRTPNRVLLSHSLPSAIKLDRFRLADLERELEPEDLESTGTVHATVWGRDTRPDHVRSFLELVGADLLITGHVPTDNGFTAPNDRQLILDSTQSPAGYCLFPATHPLTHAELLSHAGIL